MQHHGYVHVDLRINDTRCVEVCEAEVCEAEVCEAEVCERVMFSSSRSAHYSQRNTRALDHVQTPGTSPETLMLLQLHLYPQKHCQNLKYHKQLFLCEYVLNCNLFLCIFSIITAVFSVT